MGVVMMELHNNWKWVVLTVVIELHCRYGEL
jgi:hypothetical protein